MYPPLESVKCHYRVIRVMHNNSTTSRGVTVSDKSNPNIQERVPKKEYSRFLDAYYTPSSKAAGKVRTLAFSVQKRVRTIRTIPDGGRHPLGTQAVDGDDAQAVGSEM